MKSIPVFVALLVLAISAASAQTPPADPIPGIYSGSIVITRANKEMGINQVTTLLVRGEVYMGTEWFQFHWTARNFDQSLNLGNHWAVQRFVGTFGSSQMPSVTLTNNGPRIPNGTVNSFKKSATSIAYKCTTTESSGRFGRSVTVTTSFSITRVGNAPPLEN